MRDEHIIAILDNTPFADLTTEQLKVVRSHSRDCVTCRTAYQAAKMSASVLKSRAQSTFEPSAFFQTRVLAALRERQSQENVPAIVRLWRSAGALVSSMAVTTVALAVLSFMVAPSNVPVPDQAVSAYSAEAVIFGQSVDDQVSYDQVLSTIYADDDEAN